MMGPGRANAGRMVAWRVHAYEGGAKAAADVTGALRLERARVPALRAPDELLVRVRAASLNPIDLAMIGGYGAAALNAQRRLLGADGDADGGVEFPLTCGRDFCGVVEARGAGARPELRRGARVWGALPPHVTRGAHAQYVRVRDAWVGLAPESLDDRECAGAPYAALTAIALLRSAGLEGARARGASALVLGLGGAGQAAVQLLAARGARVAVGAAGEQAARAAALGAQVALDRHAADYWERVERGGPYAAVLDCAGLGGEEAGARRWRFERYATLTSPLLRETDARGLAAGALRAAGALAARALGVLLGARRGPGRSAPAGGARAVQGVRGAGVGVARGGGGVRAGGGGRRARQARHRLQRRGRGRGGGGGRGPPLAMVEDEEKERR